MTTKCIKQAFSQTVDQNLYNLGHPGDHNFLFANICGVKDL